MASVSSPEVQGGLPRLDVERPRELGEPAARELSADSRPAGLRRAARSGGRALSRRRCRPRLLLDVLPEEELRARIVVESGFKHLDEGLSVHLVECERRGEAGDRQREQNGDDDLQIREEDDTESAAAGDVDELLQGQRPDNLVFNLDELRHLVFHAS